MPPTDSAPLSPSIPGFEKKLEDLTIQGVWSEYAALNLPGVEVTGQFIREQLEQCFTVGLWTALATEERLRREPKERSIALLDRLRGEAESYLQKRDGVQQQ